jgi:hypothetical protein
MGDSLDSKFPLVIVRNAIMVTKDDFLTRTDISRRILDTFGVPTNEYRQIADDGEKYAAIWVELYNKEEIGTSYKPSPLLVAVDLEGNQITDSFIEKQVKLSAMRYRVRQIQEEYDIAPGEAVTSHSLIHKMLERVWSNEWMGQFNNGGVIYFNELADLLNIPMGAIWSLVDELVTARKADVIPSSWILESPKGETPRRGTEELYGHKEFASSDFGYWSCESCNQSGDDYTNPDDYPCFVNGN